ncbi:MAG TPA: hypothetical protein VHF67_08290 [Gaiellaceae bacterium]|jgi:hypothetical protein|nr:hypothetical protein [Gaiellaceae bacterium]
MTAADTHRLRRRLLIREANEHMAATFERLELDGPRAFVCECRGSFCMEIVYMTLAEFRALEAADGHHVVIHRHGPARDEDLVAANERFRVVALTPIGAAA